MSVFLLYIYTLHEVTTVAETNMAYFVIKGKCLSAKQVVLLHRVCVRVVYIEEDI